MTNPNQIKLVENKNGFNPVATMVVGAIVGAGVAIAGAVALSDKNNRDKVKEALINAKDQAVGYIEDTQKQAETKKGEVEQKLAEGKEKVKKIAKSTKDSLDLEVKEAKKTV